MEEPPQFTDEEGKSQEGKGLSGSSPISNAEEAQLLPIFQSRFTQTHTHTHTHTHIPRYFSGVDPTLAKG